MRFKRSFLVFVLMLTLVFTPAVMAQKIVESDNFNKEGFPIVNEPITIQFMSRKPPTTADDHNEVAIWKKYEEMTNIHIEWGLVPTAGLTERRNLSLLGEGMPEVYYRMTFPNTDLAKYGTQGVFLELTDLIEEYMPNLSAILEQYPDIRKGMTFPDGGIYGLPTIYDREFLSLIIGNKFWIRADWLEQLGMEPPETTEELYQYLKAVKETDLMGDGSGREIPFGAGGIGELRQVLTGAFGIQNRGRNHAYIDVDPETGELRFFPISEGYRELLEYMHKLYSEGLILENIYTIEYNQNLAYGAEGRYGSTTMASPEQILGHEYGSRYIGVPALEGPRGHKAYTKVGSPLIRMGGFVITNKNKHVPETLRWMDYFYSDEGAQMFFMGLEGESYEVLPDGSLEFLDHIKNNPDGLTPDQALIPYVVYMGGNYPGILKQKYFKGSEALPQSIEAAEILEPYIIDEIWPKFTFTPEEARRLTAIEGDLLKYVDEMQDKFITGAEPLSKWDDYVKMVTKRLPLDEYMKIMQAAVERYNAN